MAEPSITISFLEDGQVMCFTVSGSVITSATDEATSARYADPRLAAVRAYMWDLRKADGTGLTTEDIARSARKRQEIRRAHSDTRPAVFVADQAVSYGLLRMSVLFDEESGTTYTLQVFREVDEALRWIREHVLAVELGVSPPPHV